VAAGALGFLILIQISRRSLITMKASCIAVVIGTDIYIRLPADPLGGNTQPGQSAGLVELCKPASLPGRLHNEKETDPKQL
jgi:hypothetical protein